MAQLFGLARIGRDVELRTAGKESVANVSLAFNYGRKGEDGNRPTQWVDAAIWGKRAEALSPYLLKGGLVSVTIDDVHIETFQGKNGEGTKLVGTISGIELAGGNPKQSDQAKPAPKPPAPRGHGASFPDDDIPFAPLDWRV